MADSPEFDDFVAARSAALWRTAWLLTGDALRAEELVQAALVKTWPHFDRVDNFEAYVRRALVNTYNSWWRRTWTREVLRPTAGEERSYEDRTPDPDLMRALDRLPRAQRAVLVLRYFDDLTERETAEHLSIAVGTVKSHTSRALAALRDSSLLTVEEHS